MCRVSMTLFGDPVCGPTKGNACNWEDAGVDDGLCENICSVCVDPEHVYFTEDGVFSCVVGDGCG